MYPLPPYSQGLLAPSWQNGMAGAPGLQQPQGATMGPMGPWQSFAQNGLFGGNPFMQNAMMPWQGFAQNNFGGGFGAQSQFSPMYGNAVDRQGFANSNFTNPAAFNYVNPAGVAARINAGVAAGNPYAMNFMQQNGGVNPFAQYAQSLGVQPQTAQAPTNPIFSAAAGR